MFDHVTIRASDRGATERFYDTVLGRPGAAVEQLEATLACTASDLLRVARRYLRPEARTVVFVHPEAEKKASAA